MPDAGNGQIEPPGNGGLRKRITALSEVSALPLTARKIVHALTREDSTIQELEDVIRHDQSLASKIVAVANSAFYYSHRGVSVNSLDQAIVVLGRDAVTNIALGISLFKLFSLPPHTLKQMWAHAYRAALASSFFASRMADSDKEIAFLAGLLHDIGKVVFLTVGDKRQLNNFPGARGADGIQRERDVFLCSHMEAGYWFLRGISLPDEVVLPVLHHHDYPEGSEHPHIVAPVFIAEGLLCTLEYDDAADGAWTEKTEAVASTYGIDKPLLDECRRLLALEDEFIRGFFEY